MRSDSRCCGAVMNKTDHFLPPPKAQHAQEVVGTTVCSGEQTTHPASAAPSCRTGTTTVTTKKRTTVQPTETVAPPLPKGENLIKGVPMISQYPDLPTGCEATAAAMVLQYHGATVSANEFASDWLTCSSQFYWNDGNQYGPDPHKTFAGDPFSEASYGCYAGPIVQAVNTHGRAFTAQKITGQTLAQLCRDYIDRNKPLAVWVTMNMCEPTPSDEWYLEDGTRFVWMKGEHCMVLVGYTPTQYIFHDPQTGRRAYYKKALAQQRFAQMGAQAVYIDKKTK